MLDSYTLLYIHALTYIYVYSRIYISLYMLTYKHVLIHYSYILIPMYTHIHI